MCKEPGVSERRGRRDPVMSEGKKGLDLGIIVRVLRIPEGASPELTGEGTKYVFVLTAKKPGRI